MNIPTIICSLFALFSIVLLAVYKKGFKRPYLKSLYRGAFGFLAIYLVIQISVFISWEFFLENKISDTARNFSFITGAVFALSITLPILVIDLISTYFKHQKTNNTSIH